MKRIVTNRPEYRPHIKWVLRKLRLRTYNVMVLIASPTDALRAAFPINKKLNNYGFFTGIDKETGIGVMWVNSKLINHWNEVSFINVLAHELRHYYQAKLKKFSEVIGPSIEEYLNSPIEKDARGFGKRMEQLYESENKDR